MKTKSNTQLIIASVNELPFQGDVIAGRTYHDIILARLGDTVHLSVDDT